MRHLILLALMLATTPAAASPVCDIVENLALLAMGSRQLGDSAETARTKLQESNFRGQTALALVADFLVTEAYQWPQAAPDQRLTILQDFRRQQHARCLQLAR